MVDGSEGQQLRWSECQIWSSWKKKNPKIHTGRILSFGWNLPKCLEMPETHRNGLEFCPRWKQGPKRNGIHNIALGFFYMISTTNVVCMKSKLREVVVSTKLTLLKVLAQRFINIGSRIKGTSAPWFCTQRKDFLDFLWYGLLRLKVIVHGVCKSKTSKSHLSSRSHITYLEISLEQTSKESQENSLLCLIPYSSVSKVCLSKTCSCAILQATLHSEYHLT